ncbi:hypothetical protein V2J09_003496 [Rumex salicifolius]
MKKMNLFRKKSLVTTIEALYSDVSFNKAECKYPCMKMVILSIIKRIIKFIKFLTPKPFTIRTDCKRVLEFIQKNLDNMKAQGDSRIGN